MLLDMELAIAEEIERSKGIAFKKLLRFRIKAKLLKLVRLNKIMIRISLETSDCKVLILHMYRH